MQNTMLIYGVCFIVGCALIASLFHILTLWGNDQRIKMALIGEDLLKHDSLDSKDKAVIKFFLDNAFNKLVPIAAAIVSPVVFLAIIILDIKRLHEKKVVVTFSDYLKILFLKEVIGNYWKMSPISTSIVMVFFYITMHFCRQFRLLRLAFNKTDVNSHVAEKVEHCMEKFEKLAA